VPLEKLTTYFGFACGMPWGRDGRSKGAGVGSQRSGMNDQGSGKTVGEWWISGACILTAVFDLNSPSVVLFGTGMRNAYIGWYCPLSYLKRFGRCRSNQAI
jgi:hypothetical protein